MIECQNGIHIKGTNFWLDARRKVDFSFISHAHIDHAVRHKEILTTKETARLYEHRFGRAKFNILEYNQPKRFDSAYFVTHHAHGSKFEKPKSKDGIKVELFPSGHILGGAQILLEIEGVRIVYTGDLKLRKCLTAKKAEVKKCDILIMESTFGLPRYIFPDRKEIIDQITEFVDQALSFGQVPIFLAYSLGKAQEIMKILGLRGYKTSVHQAIFKIAKIYEKFGVKFKNYEHYQAEDLEGKVLIVPPYVRGSRMIKKIPKKRVAILTGWAIDSGCKDWFGADEAFPLSDHADFSELMEYTKLAEPQKIYTVHGIPEFPDFLRKEGFDAEPFKESTKVTKTFSKELLLNYVLFIRD
ncbi:MAG: MBL fold metallo-hydrolase [candidate division Zixibacteria bacterium]|nr:MBL fold metallo-hydrolase [candidate division Zixibacteria bacterium]